MITVDNESVWNEYVQSHSDAESFRYKVMPNWDGIVDLWGKDPVTGHGAETLVDADEVMSNEEDNNNIDIDLGSGTQGMHDLHIGDGSLYSNSNRVQKKRGQSDSYTAPIKKNCGSKEGLTLEVKKNKTGKKKTAQEEQTDGGTGNYFQWTVEMECAMVEILRDQRNLGHKADGGWKLIAYMMAASQLSTQFNVEVTSQNVKNRMKLWRKWYGIMSDIVGQSGFQWDGSKQMITVDNESVWNEYVQLHRDAKLFRYTVIPN